MKNSQSNTKRENGELTLSNFVVIFEVFFVNAIAQQFCLLPHYTLD